MRWLSVNPESPSSADALEWFWGLLRLTWDAGWALLAQAPEGFRTALDRCRWLGGAEAGYRSARVVPSTLAECRSTGKAKVGFRSPSRSPALQALWTGSYMAQGSVS